MSDIEQDEFILEAVAHGGNEPFAAVREIFKTSDEETANKYLANHWTLLAVPIAGYGHPRERREWANYVLGWKHSLPAWKPTPAENEFGPYSSDF